MSDASTTQGLSAGVQEATGHGRHRGPVSHHDGDAAPRGRHRKPAQQGQQANSAQSGQPVPQGV
ncbi:hypothetical protein ACF081_10465 [Streptomyces longwoodensis]|uniref:Uncharacterized protein n=1 Tax=Streptomyces longwoodensis TaxID=68231 RepID=A0A101QZP5_9ACTN|nr:hypothetical protein [Streptomyces longwoodensis]KUN39070.1 hypothetical protein AQJ30_09905 [Streptomyces longwoodensis]